MENYRVLASVRQQQQFQQHCQEAKDLLPALLAAYQNILAKLRSGPVTAGECLYPLPFLNLTIYVICERPLVLHYAVDESRRIVYIKDFAVLT